MVEAEGYIEANAQEISEKILRIAGEGKNEEELRIRTEHVLKDVLDKLGIAWAASYEYKTGRGTLVEGKVDALYGRVIIEYEKPHTFDTAVGFNKAKEQVRDYIQELAPSIDFYPKYFGVVLDGFQIGFVRFKKTWDVQGPLPINKQTVLKLLEAIRGLRRKPLKADLLNRDLGPESLVAKVVVRTLYRRLKGNKKPRVEMLFDDWKRVFRQVCGYSPEKLKGLEALYGLEKERNVDYEGLLFSVHTYYGLVMKLLAAEVAVSLGDSYLQSYIKKLENAYLKGAEMLKDTLSDLEEGDVFSRIGIRNFLEADYFVWYLDLWDEVLAEAVNRLAKVLSDYEPATAELEPDEVKDMLKRLYQYLVPKKIRHDLGEYYTPDWLAELVLNEVDYNGNIGKRVLDPACGSGTFLVLAIKRAKQYAYDNFIHESDALEMILKNVVGFDLNPLAVIAARTNYLIALGELIRYRRTDIEIPVFLADSILVERRTTLTGLAYVSTTIVGEFTVPLGIIEKGVLSAVLTIIEECVKGEYEWEEVKARLLKETGIDEKEATVLSHLFNSLSKLEKEGKNRIWVRVLKNSFAPLFVGKFDYIIGNPPWINWESLPEEYREKTKGLWFSYGLIKKIKGAGLGKVKKDIAMLFVTVSTERYLKDQGKLGLLVPFTLFRTVGGAGFRTFLAYKCNTMKIHDLVELTPFEGAINRTSLLILLKGKTDFPIPGSSWTRTKALDFNLSLEEVLRLTQKFDVVLEPIEGAHKPESPWLMVTEKAAVAIRRAIGQSDYEAFVGVYNGLNGAYWVEFLSSSAGGVVIRNLSLIGKKKVKQITCLIEPDLIFPFLRGRDVKKWSSTPSVCDILPHDPRSGKPISEQILKQTYPKTYKYFFDFKDDLSSRAIHKLWGKSTPFYSVYDIGDYTFAPYKVAWKLIAGKISGKGEFSTAVVSFFEHSMLGKKLAIPGHKLMFIPCKVEDEAHYVCAILNSSISRLIVKSYSIETGMSTHIPRYVKVPKFDPKNSIHVTLSQLSKKAHEYAAKNETVELTKIEEKIDEYVAELFKLTQSEIREVRESLEIFEGRATGIEKETEEEETLEKAKFERPPGRALDSLLEKFREERP